jgi:hypothetical protein
MLAQRSFRFRKNVLNKLRRYKTQPDLAVNSAKSQIIDLMSKGWNIWPLRRINVNRQHIVPGKIDVLRQIE